MPTQEDFEAFDEYYVESKERVDQRIDEIISGREDMAKKRKILAHATAGGKRIRPVLTMLVADRYEAPYDTALDHASIVELIHNACVTGDTRVRKANGESVEIREMEEGDDVLAFDTDEQRFVQREVTHFHENGVQKVVQVEMGNRTISCTPDHEFLVYQKEQPTKYRATEAVAERLTGPVTSVAARADTDASEGTVQNWLYGVTKDWETVHHLSRSDVESVFDAADIDASPEELCDSHQTEFQPPDAGYEYVQASDLSEGDVVVAAKETASGGKEWDSTFARLAGIIVGDGSVTDAGVTIAVPSSDPIRDWVVDALSEQTENSVYAQADRVDVNDVSLSRKLSRLGLSDNHTEIRIPEWVWKAGPETKRQFAAGLIDADGTVTKEGMVDIGLANSPLVRDLKELLDQLGFVTSNIWSREVSTAHIDGTPTTTTRLYHLKVGPHRVTDELLPLSPEYRERLSGFERVRTMRLGGEVVFPDGGPGFDEVGFTRVRSVTPLDEPQETYDLRVEGDHNYIADGVVTHNSLVADDLHDGDIERRGMPTTWKILDKIPFGRTGQKVTTGLTIMTENGLVALAMEIADDPDVVSAMGHGLRHLVDGFFAEGQNVTWGVLGGGYDQYIEVNRMKTGGLFAMAAWMPATYTDATEDEVMAARKYGEEVGVLYQIADDYVDDDLPSFIKDPFEEMEKWYDSAVGHIEEMPDVDNTHLMRAAPAWMVYRMATQEGEEFDVDFIPPEMWEDE